MILYDIVYYITVPLYRIVHSINSILLYSVIESLDQNTGVARSASLGKLEAANQRVGE